jgi:hypothetical protein
VQSLKAVVPALLVIVSGCHVVPKYLEVPYKEPGTMSVSRLFVVVDSDEVALRRAVENQLGSFMVSRGVPSVESLDAIGVVSQLEDVTSRMNFGLWTKAESYCRQHGIDGLVLLNEQNVSSRRGVTCKGFILLLMRVSGGEEANMTPLWGIFRPSFCARRGQSGVDLALVSLPRSSRRG